MVLRRLFVSFAIATFVVDACLSVVPQSKALIVHRTAGRSRCFGGSCLLPVSPEWASRPPGEYTAFQTAWPRPCNWSSESRGFASRGAQALRSTCGLLLQKQPHSSYHSRKRPDHGPDGYTAAAALCRASHSSLPTNSHCGPTELLARHQLHATGTLEKRILATLLRSTARTEYARTDKANAADPAGLQLNASGSSHSASASEHGLGCVSSTEIRTATADGHSGGRLVFPRLGVFPDFVEALGNFGVRQATDIQQLSIPAILEGRDTVIGAETGSGKTLGYVVGLVQNILLQKMIHEKKEDAAVLQKADLPIPRHHPYAVVIVPTRELALQVVAWARRLCRKTPVTAQLMLGTYTRWPFGTLAIPTSPDLVVCTPPVLAPFVKGGHAKDLTPFREIQMLALDEADMLLEGGYRQAMEGIFTAFRRADRQSAESGKRRTQYIFAAATIPDRGPKSVRKVISRLCPRATFFCTDSLHQHREQLQQEFVQVPAGASDDERVSLLLSRLKKLGGSDKVMIFCNTAQTARSLFEALEKALPTTRPKLFSSEIDQKDRSFNLGLFARGKSRVLVCTDAASRGLDIAGVTLVVQYDFALSAVAHLHRVGRVARGEQPGKALNFYYDTQKALVDVIQRAARDPVSPSVADAFSRKRSFRKKLEDKSGSRQQMRDRRPDERQNDGEDELPKN
ncbi:DEAD/DEAH box helicase domain-containing protein [Toxoplasma gondii GAB2-2007-GAL-DOM2]|uniref:ATP-dependent RNA helicase n=5 Tax=Toxoplasma gondii TaxID=5811 RepID=S7W411_TOXGG|nr:DEAD/DEAH box helicase domain-containing protein [Toxoplasma gondii GT1]KAF4644573.1 DEAD/DEAH box helicase domain-containing protein [Toxoplasma gondii]KFG41626.1 DEAD/DEAH box helicase domain-containing protein [Toxoplasma gondii FOU]KFG42171.1 DEAD/DEAH box helicase domain-containing protein [Toxoplasma gondii GAB2-2007-GAL-DOM2]RQX73590.1 DEAD/DEAH box helicase domain-containing protein [Toxoplasma gondii CAST]